jgi:hypothetical protein
VKTLTVKALTNVGGGSEVVKTLTVKAFTNVGGGSMGWVRVMG